MNISIYFCLAVVVILAVCMGLVLYLHEKQRQRLEELQQGYLQLQDLNRRLRSQRHDYLNHLQVVVGLLELEEYEELQKYLKPVYNDIMKTGKAIRTSSAAINALLMAKWNVAEEKGLDFYLEVKSDLKELPVEDWQMCKVLSNLIDNAVTAVEENAGEKKIWLDITEDKETYLFVVSNNGPVIPEEFRKEMFKPGITSKKEAGHGMGLYIVSNVVKENAGKLEVISEEGRTAFTVSFPKKSHTGEGVKKWNR
ncbi:MAG: Spo0B domain-containing protein [Lachnospiraceae bacterium]|nr:Spo0B domain-containing protein [Lachnospiraceae bacterium]